jgi:hypothetical protein
LLPWLHSAALRECHSGLRSQGFNNRQGRLGLVLCCFPQSCANCHVCMCRPRQVLLPPGITRSHRPTVPTPPCACLLSPALLLPVPHPWLPAVTRHLPVTAHGCATELTGTEEDKVREAARWGRGHGSRRRIELRKSSCFIRFMMLHAWVQHTCGQATWESAPGRYAPTTNLCCCAAQQSHFYSWRCCCCSCQIQLPAPQTHTRCRMSLTLRWLMYSCSVASPLRLRLVSCSTSALQHKAHGSSGIRQDRCKTQP